MRRGDARADERRRLMMKTTKPIEVTPTVYVIDDDPGVRRAITWMLESSGRRVESFSSGEAFLESYHPERSGCLVLDVRMPGMSGLALQEEIIRRGITLPVIMISGFSEVSVAVRALQLGAFDFIEKPIADAVLLERIDTAFALDAERRQRRFLRERCSSRLGRLTRREREVMAMVVAGKANKVVAYELGISQKTVESHRARVMSKLEVDSLPDLVRLEWIALHAEAA
jgi:FixJ family two-component response regulator